MVEEKGRQAEERQDEPRLWRPWRPPRRRTAWRVLWAAGMVVALVAIPLLLVNLYQLYPGMWEDLSSERRELSATLIGIVVALTVVIVLLAIGGASLGWTGFGDKTLWDWLQLLSALAIPVVLAAAGLWFTAQQDQRQQRIEDDRAQQAQKIEDQRAKAERALAKERAQDEALQTYLDQMSGLLLERDLRASEKGTEVRTLARARTLTVLSRLDPSGKTALMQFLVEADLVQRVDERDPIICLRSADLSETDLSNVIYLSGADLSGAFLRNAKLRDARLILADLSHAKLRSANLTRTILTAATLSGADLSGADLSGAFLRNADLSGANLHSAYGDANLKRAILSGAVLSGTYLSESNLALADLREANLSGADLREARLRDAYLGGANLSHAKGVTNEQLSAARSLKGATMPDGSKHP